MERQQRADGTSAASSKDEVCDATIPARLREIIMGIASELAEEFPETKNRLKFSYDRNQTSKVSVDPHGKFAHILIGGRDLTSQTTGALSSIASHESYIHGGPDLTEIRAGRTHASEEEQHLGLFNPASKQNRYFRFVCKIGNKFIHNHNDKRDYYGEYAEDVSFHLMDNDETLSEEGHKVAYNWHSKLEEAAEDPNNAEWKLS